MIQEKIFEKIKKDFFKKLAECENVVQIEELDQDFFSRQSGRMTEMMKQIKNLDGVVGEGNIIKN